MQKTLVEMWQKHIDSWYGGDIADDDPVEVCGAVNANPFDLLSLPQNSTAPRLRLCGQTIRHVPCLWP